MSKITYTLKGLTIKQMRKAGEPYWSSWHNGEKFEDEKGYKGKITFDPDNLFLKDSNNKTFDEQKAMLPKGTFIGNAATYCELAFLHYKKTGKYLFGEDYNYNYTRTTTKTAVSHVAFVGYFNAQYGLDVHGLDRVGRSGRVFVAPLVKNGKLGVGKSISKKLDRPKKVVSNVVNKPPKVVVSEKNKTIKIEITIKL